LFCAAIREAAFGLRRAPVKLGSARGSSRVRRCNTGGADPAGLRLEVNRF
jgi:hypothetical protein